MARFATVLFALFALLWTDGALAANIAILRPNGSSPALTEAATRLRGELMALGIEVETLRRPTSRELGPVDARAWLERTAAERGSDAILEVIGDTAPTGVDLWIFERSLNRSQVARVAVEPSAPNPAETLAIRAIEVLRSYFLEIDLAARAREREAAAPPPPAAAVAASSAHSSGTDRGAQAPPAEGAPDVEGRAGFELGAGVLTSFGDVGPAVLPVVRIDWAARSWLTVQATLSGLGTRPTISTSAGTAKAAQSYGVLGLCYCPVAARGLRPYLGLSAGALRTALEGDAVLPDRGHAVDQWSFLVDAGLGARLRLPDRYYATLTGHVQIAEPHVIVHFVDEEVATLGRPNVLLNLTVGAWL